MNFNKQFNGILLSQTALKFVILQKSKLIFQII